MSNLWWHNIPQHSVGDLVTNRARYRKITEDGEYERSMFLVTEAEPIKPCRVNPVQRIRLIRCDDGMVTRWSYAKGWVKVGLLV